MLPIASQEQQSVVEALINNNVIIDSVAGSGKTTCNLHIATHFQDFNILLLTYNARLKIETRDKIKDLKLSNIETHSYHSFCVKYYDRDCFTDSEIIELLKNNCLLLKSIKYDMIILDETQDMSPLYFQLVCKIFKDNEVTNPKICILGDERQSIFDFMGADQRFITFAEKIFNLNNFSWKRLTLSTSFRVTFEMSEFINNCMLHKNIIKSTKISNVKPRYIICGCYEVLPERTIHWNDELKYFYSKTAKVTNDVYGILTHYLDAYKYQPSDIFILAPSVKSNASPIRVLENRLKNERGDSVPVYVPTSDDMVLDNEILANKLVFSTFHQTKGLERKVVIALGFDSSYFKYFKRDKNMNTFVCPNELYVATTRASEHLILIHNCKYEYLDFLCKDKIKTYCDFEEIVPLRKPKKDTIFSRNTTVTELLSHIPTIILDKCYNYLKIENIREIDKKINIPVKTKQDYLFEEVSDISGIAIPSYFEYLITGRMTMINDIKMCMLNGTYGTCCKAEITASVIKKDYVERLNIQNNIKFNDILPEQITNIELIQVANLWNSIKNGLLFKLYQIKKYTWLSEENLALCVDRLYTLDLSQKSIFEYGISKIDNNKKRLVGFIDCVSNDNVYEFKCVTKLKKEHFLQLALYKYLYESQDDYIGVNNYYLYNILTDELCLIQCSYSDVCEIYELLIKAKYELKKIKSDEVFLSDVLNIKKMYMLHDIGLLNLISQ